MPCVLPEGPALSARALLLHYFSTRFRIKLSSHVYLIYCSANAVVRPPSTRCAFAECCPRWELDIHYAVLSKRSFAPSWCYRKSLHSEHMKETYACFVRRSRASKRHTRRATRSPRGRKLCVRGKRTAFFRVVCCFQAVLVGSVSAECASRLKNPFLWRGSTLHVAVQGRLMAWGGGRTPGRLMMRHGDEVAVLRKYHQLQPSGHQLCSSLGWVITRQKLVDAGFGTRKT